MKKYVSIKRLKLSESQKRFSNKFAEFTPILHVTEKKLARRRDDKRTIPLRIPYDLKPERDVQNKRGIQLLLIFQ